MRRALDRAIAWLGDVGPLLGALGFISITLVNVFFPNNRTVVYSTAGGLAVLVIVVRELVELSPLVKRRLRVAAMYVILILFIPILLMVDDIRSTVHRLESTAARSDPPIAKTIEDIRGTVHRIERNVTVSHPPIPIVVKNSPLGGLYNSSYDYLIGKQLANKVPHSLIALPPPGYTHVFAVGDQGSSWVVQGNESSFSFDRHPDGYRAAWANSGAYVSFPDVVINRLIYRYLTFDCKVTDSEGQPDLGVRLAVDDPQVSEVYKEVAVYELSSLSERYKAKPLSAQWQDYEVYTPSFSEQSQGQPRASNMDENEINKIVFFVNDSMLSKSRKGTIWIRNIVFSTTPHPDR